MVVAVPSHMLTHRAVLLYGREGKCVLCAISAVWNASETRIATYLPYLSFITTSAMKHLNVKPGFAYTYLPNAQPRGTLDEWEAHRKLHAHVSQQSPP